MRLQFGLALISTFVALSFSATTKECVFSDWGAWSSCERENPSHSVHTPFSYPLPLTDAADRGRAMMGFSMAEKMAVREERRKCQEERTCPELNPRPTARGEVKCNNGMAGIYPCRNIDLLSEISIEDLGYTKELQQKYSDKKPQGNDIWGWTDDGTGHEYAIVCLSGGTSFVDVTDATNPKVLAFLATRTTSSIWRDVKVVDNTAYIVSEAKNHGLQVFDLLRLRGITEFQEDISPDNEYSLFGNAHNIVSNEDTGYVYVVGATDKKYPYSCAGGLHFINVRDRLNPAFAGCFPDDGYVHDAQCVIYTGPDAAYQGREICFCYNEDSLTLVDVTNKERPLLISKEGYSHSMYTHQGWLTEDMTTLLLDDELDEHEDISPDPNRLGHTITYVWDVSDLEKPRLRSHFISDEVAIDHNQYILGDLSYQSNYGAGLRVLHIDQPSYSLKEVAYFDVLPIAAPTAEFEGSWSNYPYFKSGNIIVSSIEYGLFVVRPDQAAIKRAISQPSVASQSRGRTLEYAKPEAACPGTVESRPCAQEQPQA